MDIERERLLDLYSQRASMLERAENIRLQDKQHRRGAVERRLAGELTHFEATKQALRRESLQGINPLQQRGRVALLATKLKESNKNRTLIQNDLGKIKEEVVAIAERVAIHRTRREQSLSIIEQIKERTRLHSEEIDSEMVEELYSLQTRSYDGASTTTSNSESGSSLKEDTGEGQVSAQPLAETPPVFRNNNPLPDREHRAHQDFEMQEPPAPRDSGAHFSMAQHTETISHLDAFQRGAEEGLHLTYRHPTGGEFQVTVTDNAGQLSVAIDTDRAKDLLALSRSRDAMAESLITRGVSLKQLSIGGKR